MTGQLMRRVSGYHRAWQLVNALSLDDGYPAKRLREIAVETKLDFRRIDGMFMKRLESEPVEVTT